MTHQAYRLKMDFMQICLGLKDLANDPGKNCSNNPHTVFDLGGVEGGGSARVFMLADQNFPLVLPAVRGGCVSMVRVENG